MRALSLAIVGIQYPNKKGPTRRFEVELCRPGEPIELRPEPKNPADENAVAIYSCRGVQLGYVTAERAPLVRSWFANGREIHAVFQGLSATGAWVRVGLDGESPLVDPNASTTLRRMAAPPPVADRPIYDPHAFCPDPVWDD